MIPGAKWLSQQLSIFVENDTIRPEVFIEVIERRSNPLKSLVWLFNHIDGLREVDLRHIDLQQELETTLSKKYCVWTLAKPVTISKKCYIKALNNEALLHIANRLDYNTLEAFSGVSRRFRSIALTAIASSSDFIQKFVEKALARPIKRDFPNAPYHRKYELEVSRLRTTDALLQFPMATKVTVMDATVKKKVLQDLLLRIGKLEELTIFTMLTLSDQDVSMLPFPPSLKACSIMYPGDATVLALAKKCPNLEKLSLRNCKTLTIAAFSKTPFKNLRELDLSSAKYSDLELRGIFRLCPNVRSLSLTHCSLFTGSTLVEHEEAKFLEELNVSGTGFTGENLHKIFRIAKNLHSLNVSYCEDISEQAFAEAEYPSSLKNFTANWSNFGVGGLMRIQEFCVIESIEISDTNVVDDAHVGF
jgi:hypothetical protein